MKPTAMVFLMLALAACAPAVPNSGAPGTGVGFEDYSDYSSYRTAREEELRGNRQPVTVQPPAQAPLSGPATLPASGPATTTATPLPAAPAERPVDPNNPTISDENDFGAVANRETIESDAARLRERRETYEVIAPTALPNRAGVSGPNIVEYAISTRNPVGQRVYRRTNLGGAARYERNCAKYTSSDLAQEAFLRQGGPERDKLGLDPDGDGFACLWDPTPFRRIGAGRG